MPTDALSQLQASVTKTANFSSAAFNLPGGTPRRGLKVRVLYSAASANTGGDTVTFTVDVSHDGGTNYYTEAESDPISLPGSGSASGEIFIPFEISPTSVANQTYIKLSVAFSSTAHADTITYQGDPVISRP